jgi:ketosteroid isomerase-like protein
MRTQVILLLTFLLFFTSCNQAFKKEENKTSNVQKSFNKASDTLSAHHKWMQAINDKNIELLSRLYTENAMVLSENGVDLASKKEILELVPNSNFIVKAVSVIKRIHASDTYDYEIGSFINKDDGLAKHLIIWNTSDGNTKRELEFITETTGAKVDLDVIKKQRTEWIRLCNAHDANTLIETLYTENRMYYNKGRLLTGRVDLVTEYEYMNNPQYNLTLNPILIEPVSETIVYEMGQCKGSYDGKYLLVWQKNSNGVWKVLFDSNI